MTVKEAIEYIDNYTWSSTRLGLDRTRELLSLVGNPENRLKFVHVAGTNGKGSTCAMLSSILMAAGYKTGFYPSPYIVDFRERIQINGEYISGEDLAYFTEIVAKAADSMEDHPSQFELITAIGLLYFEKMGCDIVVLEVGMGGAYDSTNIIPAPEVAVITNIGLDHTEYLGTTVEEIAATKGGIIKAGSAVVCYENTDQVMRIIEDICSKEGDRLYKASFSDIMPIDNGFITDESGNISYRGQQFIWKDKEYRLNLAGSYQLRNVTTVLKLTEALNDRGYEITEDNIREGLTVVSWPARFEVLGLNPLFILDGGHNPQCAAALSAAITDCIGDEKVTFLMGVLADKDYEEILRVLHKHAASFVCITPDNPRALNAEDLKKSIENTGLQAVTAKELLSEENEKDSSRVKEITRAIEYALSLGRPVIAFGSLYSAGEIRRCLHSL